MEMCSNFVSYISDQKLLLLLTDPFESAGRVHSFKKHLKPDVIILDINEIYLYCIEIIAVKLQLKKILCR